MKTNRPLPIDWSHYVLKADIVAREIRTLAPLPLGELDLPPVAPRDFAVLLDSVQANGVIEPLTITPDGHVVDGNARLHAAELAGVHQVPTRVLESRGGPEDYALWAATVNIARRHLTSGQRFALVKSVLALLEQQARERQQATRFGARPTLSAPPGAPGVTDVRSQVAGLTGVSRSHAAKMVSLARHASPDVQNAVISGRSSVHRAHQTLRGPARASPHDRDGDAGASDVSGRHKLARNPVRTLRFVAALIAEWAQEAVEWPGERQTEFLKAMHNLVDSCELAFRRLRPVRASWPSTDRKGRRDDRERMPGGFAAVEPGPTDDEAPPELSHGGTGAALRREVRRSRSLSS